MIKKFTFLLLMLAQSAVFSQGFNDVYSYNGQNVFAVGTNGSLFYSIDAGNTWSSYIISSSTLNSITASGVNIWIAGNSGSLIKSTNYGGSWTNLSSGTSKNLNSVFFSDALNGWAAGDSVILRTTNGGNNWLEISSPKIYSVKFKNNSEGFACGEKGTILHTTNGGVNWSSLSSGTQSDLLRISFSGNVIIATGADGFILKSANNGVNWTFMNYNIVTKSRVTGIHMFDSLTFYTSGGGGFIRKTTDGGETYEFQQNPMMAELTNIYFYDQLTGWSVNSRNNAVMRTTTGGASWLLPQGTTVTYQWQLKQSAGGNIGNGFAHHPVNKNGMFIMMGNNLYRSFNKGETWTLIGSCTIGGSAHTFYINAIDTNLMLCSKGSSGGYVCKSTNYGQTWTAVWGPGQLTSYGMPLEADPVNHNTVYLGPDNDTLMKSTDYGSTWETIGQTKFRSPCDIAVSYEDPDIIYVGDGTTGVGNGEFFMTSNGGLNWRSVHTISGSEIPMIAISSLDHNLAYHSTWGSGGMWKTTNKWDTFQQINTLGNLWACDIAKDDPTAVSWGNYGSSVYISTNSGSNYATTNVGSSPQAGMFYYDKANLLAQHGGGVYKLYANYNVIVSNQQISTVKPDEFRLHQNYPNPFNPVTTIEYEVPVRSLINISVYDITGKLVRELVSKEQSAGKYNVNFDAGELSSGIYFYVLSSDGQRKFTNKMVLIK